MYLENMLFPPSFEFPPEVVILNSGASSTDLSPAPLGIPTNMHSDMFCLDNLQAVGKTQLHSSAPLLLPFIDKSDILEFCRYSKEKYKSQKIGCRKTSRDEPFDNSSLDGDYDNDTSRCKIKDSFEELHKQLPTTYTGHRLCKAVLLQKAVSHIKKQSREESFLLDKISRLKQFCAYLNAELEKEKRMNELYRQKQTIEKIFAAGL
ncbi:12863_t:CDS:2 [Gigaspora margarita]|uniref:12863_t:CDS:1 n=1 Tax=Gigaspora margarita TaxID=4874 RepID=A0ABN7UFR7_GIGMA|nr:12863_t:CDS:2 [Gigaspora margarita]